MADRHPPKLDNGQYDKEAVKQLYFDSPHLNWTSFAKSRGWHPMVTRNHFPTRAWKKSKQKMLDKVHAEEFKDLTFDDIPVWKKDVMRTMREYPKSIENIKETADIALLQLRRKYNRDMETWTAKMQSARTEAEREALSREEPEIDLVKLTRLATTMRACTEAKHKSLLLNEIRLQIAQEPISAAEEAAREGEGERGFFMKIIGKGNLSLAEIAAENARWYDRPQIDVSPTKPAEIAEEGAPELNEESHGDDT